MMDSCCFDDTLLRIYQTCGFTLVVSTSKKHFVIVRVFLGRYLEVMVGNIVINHSDFANNTGNLSDLISREGSAARDNTYLEQ